MRCSSVPTRDASSRSSERTESSSLSSSLRTRPTEVKISAASERGVHGDLQSAVRYRSHLS